MASNTIDLVLNTFVHEMFKMDPHPVHLVQHFYFLVSVSLHSGPRDDNHPVLFLDRGKRESVIPEVIPKL